MMPATIQSRRDVYTALLGPSFWVRQQKLGRRETGHTLLYRPVRGITLSCLEKEAPRLRAVRSEIQELLGLTEAPPAILTRQGEDVLPLVKAHLNQGHRTNLAVFEGYTLSSKREGRDRNARLAELFRKHAVPAILAKPEAADAWNEKPYFRRRAVGILGADVVPRGRAFDRADATGILRYAKHLFAEAEQRVIVKLSGAGGHGNLLLEPEDNHPARLGKFLKSPPDHESWWAVVEAWRPWEHTFCCSYFITDDRIPPIPLEICEQLFSPESNQALGRRSFTDISNKDLRIIQDFLMPVLRAMQDDGIRGFAAIDVILAKPKASDVLALPDCGLGVLLIEANARINGHNQERLFVESLARRDGLDLDEVQYLRAGNRPIESAADRAGSQTVFQHYLEGYAEPLTSQPMRQGVVYFVLDDNHGRTASQYDAVLFVARRGADTEEAIMSARNRFQLGGYLSV